MIVRDFNFVGIASLPSETNPILIVDPDTVLPAPVSTQPFEAISPWNSKFADVSDSIDLIELPPGNLPQNTGTDPSGNGRVDPIEDVLSALPTERPYHGCYYNGIRNNHQSLPCPPLRRDDSRDPLSKNPDPSLHGSGSPGYWEPDDLLCSRNALGLVCLVIRSFWSVWFFWMNFQSDQPNKPDRPDEPAFVRRAQWETI
jgi:hypothetical protein